MSHSQQPELRRSDKGVGTPQDSQARKAAEPTVSGGRAHGTDRGKMAVGKGGGTPSEQQLDHLA